MATVEKTRRTATPGRVRDPQVYHPLDRLRAIIRRYVIVEGLLSALLFATVWFALGLVLDFGVFKATGWDWAQDGAWGIRLLALTVALLLFAGILAYRILMRVTREFSYPALALVLERRFPKILGDRLITAVEMADVEAMAKFGYSEEMIRATIAEARERVAKVPVGQVFNWRRLWVMAFLTFGLLGCTALFGFNSYAFATSPDLLSGLRAKVVFALVLSFVNLALFVWVFRAKWMGLGFAVPTALVGYLLGFTHFGDGAAARVLWVSLLFVGLLLAFLLNMVAPIAVVVQSLVSRRVRPANLAVRGVLLLLPYLLLAGYALATTPVSPYRFASRAAHVTGIFAERNVALLNTPWPRQAHVELVGFPESGEATVSQSVASVPITARAYKWVIADRRSPEGWRPLMWSDVTPDLVGGPVPEFDFQALRAADEAEGSMPGDASKWTADAVERRVLVGADAGSSHPSAALGNTMGELQAVLAALDARADQPSMGRTLRKLNLTRTVMKATDDGQMVASQEPIELTYRAEGKKKRYPGTLRPVQNNEFEGTIDKLEEDVEFVVKADDFATRPLRIRLIPPPTLKRLYRVQEEPAYLHHAPPADQSFDYLKGKRQLMGEKTLSLTGERSVFVVPAGTQLTLLADAYTDDAGGMSDNDAIVSAYVTPVVGKFPGAVFGDDGKTTANPVPVTLTPDGKGFSIAFRNLWEDMGPFTQTAVAVLQGMYPPRDERAVVDFRLKDPVEFKVTWTNRYKVSNTRSVLIQVAQDQPPVVEVGVDVIRKAGNVYLVTPMAKIPLNPDSFVRDDHGLSQVEYAYNYYAEDSELIRVIRVGLLTRALLSAPHVGPQSPNSLVLPQWHAENFRNVDKSDDRKNGLSTLAEFDNQATRLRRRTVADFAEKLRQPSGDDINPEAVRKLDLKNADRDFFDLDAKYPDGHPKARQRVFDLLAKDNEPQASYRMDVYVQATDNNADADGGPRVTRSAEPLRLRIISEGELLVEINKEELQLGERLDEALVKLNAAKKKYEFVVSSNNVKEETPEQVDAVKVRHQDALQDVDKARDIVQTILREFRRIHRECQVNRVSEAATNNFLKYCTDLEAILSEDPNAKVAFPRTLVQLNNVQNTLNGGRWAPGALVTDAQHSLYELERELTRIREGIGKDGNREEIIRSLRLQIEKQKLVEEMIRKLQKQWDIDNSSRTVALNVNDAPPLVLNKNESKKVKHKIAWRQYPDQEVVVTLKSSDASITVPAELKLDFEKNEFTFEFDVKAGTVAGNFTITLTAGAGKPVELPVAVK